MRGDSSSSPGPYRTWYVEVDDQNRVRVERSLASTVSWLVGAEAGSVECAVIPASVGVQVVPIDSHSAERATLDALAANLLPAVSDGGSLWLDAFRLVATSWRMTIHLEPSRVSLTLPEALRRSGQLPGSGGRVVVFAFGSVLQVATASDWFERMKQLAPQRNEVIGDTIAQLEGR